VVSAAGPGAFVPARGDVVWITFDPAPGHEQRGRRPAVVLSPEAYNRAAGRALFCPVTSHRRGYPFEVAIPEGLPVEGVILADHVKSFDWRARRAEAFCRLPQAVVEDVLARLGVLVLP
jgi:mRNA interferase MazF